MMSITGFTSGRKRKANEPEEIVSEIRPGRRRCRHHPELQNANAARLPSSFEHRRSGSFAPLSQCADRQQLR